VTLVIRDNGVGLDPGKKSPPNGTGLGLFGISERLSLVGGNVQIESTKGQGTTITARVPVSSMLGPKRRAT
jgi:two-component system sensor histidine kinase NreB